MAEDVCSFVFVCGPFVPACPRGASEFGGLNIRANVSVWFGSPDKKRASGIAGVNDVLQLVAMEQEAWDAVETQVGKATKLIRRVGVLPANLVFVAYQAVQVVVKPPIGT